MYIIILIIHLASFLAIGLSAAFLLLRRRFFPKEFTLIAAIGCSSILGYVTFFAYLADPRVGKLMTLATYAVGLVALGNLIHLVSKQPDAGRIAYRYVFPPLILMFVVAGIYSTTTFTCHYELSPASRQRIINDSCMLQNKSSDNILPQIFANKLIANQANVPAGTWNLADRTPLQIGMVVGLLNFIKSNAASAVAYEYMGMFLQLSWIAVLWGLLVYIKVKKRVIFLVLWLLIFSGFFYYNSVFVWPKLYSASLILAAIGILMLKPLNRNKPPTLRYLISAALLIDLGYLAHPEVAFTILALAIILPFRWRIWRLGSQYGRTLIVALAVGIAFLAPWQAYASSATHSSRLIKWHLAGVQQPDNRGTLQTIIGSYRSLPFSTWVYNKEQNTETLFKPDYKKTPLYLQTFLNFSDLPAHNLNVIGTQRPIYYHIARIRLNEFYYPFLALGILNLGWIVFVLKPALFKTLPYIRPMLTVVAVTLLVWVLLMFNPGETKILQGSYVTMMLLFTVLGLAISQAPKYLMWFIGLLQFMWFWAIWVFSLYMQNGYSWLRPSILAIASAITLIATFILMERIAAIDSRT